MITRRGFLGLVAAAAGASALPTLGWLDAAPAAAPTEPPVRLRYFSATAGASGGRVLVKAGSEILIDISVEPMNTAHWFGNYLLGPGDKLSTEIEGDVTWGAYVDKA